MDALWNYTGIRMLLLCYYICMLPKVFFSISFFFFFSEILSSFFVFLFQKEKMGKRKVCKRTAKTCVYIFLKREQKNHVKKSRLMIRYYYRRHSNFKTDLVKREREEYDDADAVFQGGLFRWILGTLVLSIGWLVYMYTAMHMQKRTIIRNSWCSFLDRAQD